MTVALLDKFQSDIPKGPSRKKMEENGKLKKIRVARSDTDKTIREKILAAFKMKIEYHYLECVSFGSKLIQSSNQAMNGQDATDRRGCLYICKKSKQVRTVYLFIVVSHSHADCVQSQNNKTRYNCTMLLMWRPQEHQSIP